MKMAKVVLTENGLFSGEIKDEFGDIESATLDISLSYVAKWAIEHGCLLENIQFPKRINHVNQEA